MDEASSLLAGVWRTIAALARDCPAGGGWVPPQGSAEGDSERCVAKAGDFFFFFLYIALLIDRSIDGGGWVPPKGSAERYSERRVAEAGDIIGMFIYMFLFIFH